MKASKLLYIGLFNLISCLPTEKPDVTGNIKAVDNIFTLCFEPVTKEVFVSAKQAYKEKLLQDTLSFKKQNGQLKLPLSSGINTYKIFQDSIKGSEDENKKEYNYLGQFKEIDFYVVSVTYWEHFEVLLIDKKSGNHYSIWSVPSLSPNNKRIATIPSSGLEGEPVGIQILSINKTNYTQIEKVIEINQQLWNPVDFVWEDNNSVILKVTELADHSKGKKEVVFSYLRLKIN
jgi:hypothetical protein